MGRTPFTEKGSRGSEKGSRGSSHRLDERRLGPGEHVLPASLVILVRLELQRVELVQLLTDVV